MRFEGELKTEFDDFAKAISDVLETDVIIADANMNVIGSAFQYFSLYQDIQMGSLMAEVFYDNRDVLLEHKRDKASCRQCVEYITVRWSPLWGYRSGESISDRCDCSGAA